MKLTRLAAAIVLSSSLAASGCAGSAAGKPAAGSAEAASVQRATATLAPTKGNQAHGTATFTRDGAQIKVEVKLENTPPGVHAVHVHETGDCSADDASSAGGHWNPTTKDHGHWGVDPFHLGDIGNVTVGEDGSGSIALSTDLWSLGSGSSNDVLGHAVIVHASPDDFQTQPTGAAGGRIACGVIAK
jgi:Cu-Zn family superoxide dismutase